MVIIFIIIALIITFYIFLYNNLISAKNYVEKNKSTIETVFQNRYDLIPNLVEVVKQYTSHEDDVLTKVTKIRSELLNQSDKIDKNRLEEEGELSQTLKSIFALSENYPDLKANENFLNLQNQWQEIEDRMQAARRWYNTAVKILNDKKEMIPSNFVALTMNIKDYPMYESDKNAKISLNAKDLFNK